VATRLEASSSHNEEIQRWCMVLLAVVEQSKHHALSDSTSIENDVNGDGIMVNGGDGARVDGGGKVTSPFTLFT